MVTKPNRLIMQLTEKIVITGVNIVNIQESTDDFKIYCYKKETDFCVSCKIDHFLPTTSLKIFLFPLVCNQKTQLLTQFMTLIPFLMFSRGIGRNHWHNMGSQVFYSTAVLQIIFRETPLKLLEACNFAKQNPSQLFFWEFSNILQNKYFS